jgi:hypothetical protein
MVLTSNFQWNLFGNDCVNFHYYNMWPSSLYVSLDFEWTWANLP